MPFARRFIYSLAILSLLAACTPDYSFNQGGIYTWMMAEHGFESSNDYSSGGSDSVMMDVAFTHKRSGETLIRPAFWDGGSLFLVRFAPTRPGKWEWKSSCPQDVSLDGLEGTFRCKKYEGDLQIYRHGFLRVEPGKKYLTYADGTPFFYLGDTHWGMYTEEFDSPGPNAGDTGAGSHFKYIVDRRVGQGFTVYQSEPIGAEFNLTDGKVDSEDIPGFRAADEYYKYIAGAGLVHANSEFFFAGSMRSDAGSDEAALKALSRYWVARFGAFPVMWTLAQEIDNSFYGVFDFSDNPWVRVAEYIHGYDAYGHPLSGHQENSWHTSVTGRGTGDEKRDAGGMSVFASKETAAMTGHNWWAVQWSPSLTGPVDPGLVRDYWEDPRPAVNYEGRYCGLWTKDFGSRAQGWISFLSGFFGYGYGAIDIWLYKSNYDVNTVTFDGVEYITPEDKNKPWSESIEYPSAVQMGYLRSFMESFDWWNLKPVLSDDRAFKAASSAYVYARTDNVHVLYFFSKDKSTGVITDIPADKAVDACWFNPRSGEWTEVAGLSSGQGGELVLPEKPDDGDWVLMVSNT